MTRMMTKTGRQNAPAPLRSEFGRSGRNQLPLIVSRGYNAGVLEVILDMPVWKRQNPE